MIAMTQRRAGEQRLIDWLANRARSYVFSTAAPESIAAAALVLLFAGVAHAIEAITVEPNQEKIDITAKGELYEGRGDRLQIETAPGPDGYIGRMAVSASTPGTNPGWLVFALTNPTAPPR